MNIGCSGLYRFAMSAARLRTSSSGSGGTQRLSLIFSKAARISSCANPLSRMAQAARINVSRLEPSGMVSSASAERNAICWRS